MSKTTSCIRVATGLALVAGMAVLSGCGPAPYSQTSTSERTTTTIPPPMVTTETVTTRHATSRE